MNASEKQIKQRKFQVKQLVFPNYNRSADIQNKLLMQKMSELFKFKFDIAGDKIFINKK